VAKAAWRNRCGTAAKAWGAAIPSVARAELVQPDQTRLHSGCTSSSPAAMPESGVCARCLGSDGSWVWSEPQSCLLRLRRFGPTELKAGDGSHRCVAFFWGSFNDRSSMPLLITAPINGPDPFCLLKALVIWSW